MVEGKEMRKRFFNNNHNLKNLIYSLKHEEEKLIVNVVAIPVDFCGQRAG